MSANMSATFDLNERPDYDEALQKIADYVLTYEVKNEEAWNTARLCLMDTLGCGLLALQSAAYDADSGMLVWQRGTRLRVVELDVHRRGRLYQVLEGWRKDG